jgi:cytochrome oxidase Cu insertion factor (SCO1/SenC/PrrC family)
MQLFSASVTACAVVLGAMAATNGSDQPPDAKTGLKVGVKAPIFKLKDQNGKDRELDEFLKKGKVALVFYRSASW